jgi:hypothetical protein
MIDVEVLDEEGLGVDGGGVGVCNIEMVLQEIR